MPRNVDLRSVILNVEEDGLGTVLYEMKELIDKFERSVGSESIIPNTLQMMCLPKGPPKGDFYMWIGGQTDGPCNCG